MIRQLTITTNHSTYHDVMSSNVSPKTSARLFSASSTVWSGQNSCIGTQWIVNGIKKKEPSLSIHLHIYFKTMNLTLTFQLQTLVRWVVCGIHHTVLLLMNKELGAYYVHLMHRSSKSLRACKLLLHIGKSGRNSWGI